MKQSTFFIFCGALALGSFAIGFIGAIHEKRKEKKRKPSATFRELYEDNAYNISENDNPYTNGEYDDMYADFVYMPW